VPRFDVVSLGEPLYELNRQPDGRFLPGVGGDTLNVAVAAARLGSRCAYLSRLGDDIFGAEIRDLMQREGIDASGVGIDAAAPTGLYFITHGPQGHVFTYRRQGSAASLMTASGLTPDLIAGAGFFHASGISQAISASACDAVFAAMEAARAAGRQVSFDTNLRLRLWPLARARAVIGASIALSDMLFVSVEEGEQLCGTTEPDAILSWCHERGARRVALKLGPQGAIGSDGSRRERVPGYAVKAVDATGAGDCFAGALLARMAAGEDFFQAIAYANAAAALTCTGFGAVAPLPRPPQVQALLSTRVST
jgi:2-dehydro-3-deoxygluconokinase